MQMFLLQEAEVLAAQQEVVEDIMNTVTITDYKPGDHVVVRCGARNFVALILNQDQSQFEVKYMKWTGILLGQNEIVLISLFTMQLL